MVNGKPIARGEVVVTDEEFGLRVTEVVTSETAAPAEAAAPAPAPPAGVPVPQA